MNKQILDEAIQLKNKLELINSNIKALQLLKLDVSKIQDIDDDRYNEYAISCIKKVFIICKVNRKYLRNFLIKFINVELNEKCLELEDAQKKFDDL